jgi:hypothetical protein
MGNYPFFTFDLFLLTLLALRLNFLSITKTDRAMKSKPKVKTTTKKNVVMEGPTDSDSTISGIDGEDFGGIGQDQEESSETEKRKNVNADPNLIQGNKLKGKK